MAIMETLLELRGYIRCKDASHFLLKQQTPFELPLIHVATLTAMRQSSSSSNTDTFLFSVEIFMNLCCCLYRT